VVTDLTTPRAKRASIVTSLFAPGKQRRRDQDRKLDPSVIPVRAAAIAFSEARSFGHCAPSR
jgi:hypothetical protein